MDELNFIWQTLKPTAKRKQFPKKTNLVLEGTVCDQVYLVEEGCLRSWFNDDGRDITFQFFFENALVSSLESLKMNKPCLFNIETITQATLLVVEGEAFFQAIRAAPAMTNAALELLCRRFYHYQKLFLSRIKNTPQRRYEELLEENPEIFDRAPHHYIASYLGITPVSLSRIRAKKNR